VPAPAPAAAATLAPAAAATLAQPRAHELAHAYHCTSVNCPIPMCSRAKSVVRRLRSHFASCDRTAGCKPCELYGALSRTGARQTFRLSAPAAGAPHSALNLSAATGPAHRPFSLAATVDATPPPLPLLPAAGEYPVAGASPAAGESLDGGDAPSPREASSVHVAARERLRELPAEKIKEMMVQHVRSCQRGDACGTCRKLRERIRAQHVRHLRTA
jgi:hypothetical protein